MSIIKIDLADEALTVKKFRELVGFSVNAQDEVVYVQYREIKHTGTVGSEDYNEISNTDDNYYKSDYSEWIATDAGQAIQAAIEANLAKDIPGS
jgi:hypothetical protein